MNNWAFNLDMLAQNGVIDFDAPAYIKGTAPRYVGNPVNPNPFNDYVPNGTNLQQPQNDGFNTPENTPAPTKNPNWKKWLFGALAVGALAVGAYKFRKNLIPWVQDGWNKVSGAFKWKSVKDFFKTKTDAVKNFFKNGWNKIKTKVNFPKIKDFCVDKFKSAGDFVKKYWSKLVNVFKKP